VYFLISYRIKKENLPYKRENIVILLLAGVIIALICGRIGYVLIYNLKYFSRHPLQIFLPIDFSQGNYKGLRGLSYHGGLAGILIASVIVAKRYKTDFWKLGDIFISAIPLGYMFGRIGNFINGELYGRITNSFLGMYFPADPTHSLRHPSQLYEAFFEGLILFIILWSLRKKKIFDGFLFSMYFIGYGLARFFTEFFREPDPVPGFVLDNITMGQLFSLVMISIGFMIILIKGKAVILGKETIKGEVI
jgi:phosphatidylglycerol:prolipoprotein diacylglycerol transferase